MFDMHYRTADGRIVRGGMACDGHADRPVFVTKNGSQLTAKDWKTMKRLALDKPIKPFNGDLVRQKDHPEAFDAEHRLDMLRHILRGYGLDDESVEEACEICRRELAGETTEDELPISGPAGAGGKLSKQSREPDEKVFRSPGHFERRPPLGTTASSEERSMIGEATYRSSPASDSFAADFSDAMRIGFSYGSGQFDEERHDRRTKRQRRIAADAVSPASGARLSEMFPDIERVGIGCWPSRR
jgi:hypothetical protein